MNTNYNQRCVLHTTGTEVPISLPIRKALKNSTNTIYSREMPRYNAMAWDVNIEYNALTDYEKILASNLVPEALQKKLIHKYKSRNFKQINCFDPELTFPPLVKSPPYLNPNVQRVLDAPSIIDDYYTSVLDLNDLALAILLEDTFYVMPNIENEGGIEEINPPLTHTPHPSMAWGNDTNLLTAFESNQETILGICDLITKQWFKIPLFSQASVVTVKTFDADVVMLGDRAGHLHAIDLRTNKKIFDVNPTTHSMCSISTRGDRVFASGSNSNSVYVWDFKKIGEPVFSFEHLAATKALAFNPAKPDILASGGGTADREIKLTNVASQQMVHATDTGGQVCGLSWNVEGNKLITNLGFNRNSINVYDYMDRTRELRINQKIEKAHENRVLFNANSKPVTTYFVTGSSDETVRIWKVDDKPKKIQKKSKSIDYACIR